MVLFTVSFGWVTPIGISWIVLALIVLWLGMTYRARRDYVAAGYAVLPLRQHPRVRIEWLETALAAARRLRDRKGEGTALGNLGNA